MIYDTLLSRTLNLLRTPAFLQPFLLAKKVEGRSIRTLGWYQESIGGFNLFCETSGFDPSPSEIKPFHVRAWLAYLQDRGLGQD